jgi:hypothetical protein
MTLIQSLRDSQVEFHNISMGWKYLWQPDTHTQYALVLVQPKAWLAVTLHPRCCAQYNNFSHRFHLPAALKTLDSKEDIPWGTFACLCIDNRGTYAQNNAWMPWDGCYDVSLWEQFFVVQLVSWTTGRPVRVILGNMSVQTHHPALAEWFRISWILRIVGIFDHCGARNARFSESAV